MGTSIVEIRRSYERLISTIGFPILVRWHLYIKSGAKFQALIDGYPVDSHLSLLWTHWPGPSGPDWLWPPSCRSSSYPGDTYVTILSVYIPSNNHLISRDLTYLTRNIRGQILIMGDFNGHSYLWGSHDVDTRGELIERFTDKHNLCILNDGTHTYLKPQAQHANKPTSAIDLTISTPGLALRSVWEVLPDTHGSDHYLILISILPSVAEIQPSCDPPHWVFSKANWEQFHVLGKHLWGHTRGSRSLALLCRAHNQGRKWLHPMGSHHPKEIKPLVWWRMPGSPEG